MFVALAGIMVFQNFCNLWIVQLGRREPRLGLPAHCLRPYGLNCSLNRFMAQKTYSGLTQDVVHDPTVWFVRSIGEISILGRLHPYTSSSLS